MYTLQIHVLTQRHTRYIHIDTHICTWIQRYTQYIHKATQRNTQINVHTQDTYKDTHRDIGTHSETPTHRHIHTEI